MTMFRPTKKRPKKPHVVRTRDDVDAADESPDETTGKSPRKKQARSVMSFDVDGEENSSKKKKRKRGMGFGGAMPPEQVQADNEGTDHADEAPTLYGQDALDKLKSEQRYKQREAVETAVDAVSPPETTNGTVPPSALPSYIPLSDTHVILTGDEAMEYEEKQDSAPLHTTTEDTVLDAEEAEESSAWEAQVASRAGVRTSSKPTQRSEISSTASTANLTKLRDQVTSTISQLKLQTHDIQNACARRQVEVAQTQEELTRQETELQQAGIALEYYQALREDLSSWVGALRELRNKIMPLQEALHKVERIGGNRWTEWQDDVVSILREAGILDRVVGRQPLDEELPITTLVDEFGRDVTSQYALQREKRARHRRAIRKQRTVRDEDSDVLISDGEHTEMKKRRDALREALNVAVEDVDEEYTKLSNLIRIFAKWASNYPEEYRQCFASLSLADLASILVQVDLCSTHHPLHWQVDSEQLPWLEDLQTIPIGDEEEDTPSYRMVDKVLIPIFIELLDEGAYHIISTKETRSLASFYWRICKLFPKRNSMTLQLTARIAKYLREGLDNIAIPILKSGAKDQSHSDDVREAIEYATSGQVRRIQKFVCNLVAFWKLDATAEPVLDFLSSTFLFLISSSQAQECSAVASESFGRVWAVLQSTGWLERPELMLQAAPIRAAAVVYGIQR